ncbi:MAG TPA: hypothetical protein G4O10_10810 [Dehalococcoidia bacterium]|nr:hypothetical protein [Dehalococcoidia bacterium]
MKRAILIISTVIGFVTLLLGLFYHFATTKSGWDIVTEALILMIAGLILVIVPIIIFLPWKRILNLSSIARVTETQKHTEARSMAATAGVIDMVVGAVYLCIFLISSTVYVNFTTHSDSDMTGAILINIFSGVFGVLAIAGGIFARKLRKWRWALAGSICSVFSLIGILAIFL